MRTKSKVSIVKCEDYNQSEIDGALTRAVDLLGGIRGFVKGGDRVLLKPNLLAPQPPESGVCTHPTLVRAVIRLVKEAGGLPLVGDSPGGAVSTEKVYERSGIEKVAKEEGAELVKFDKVKEIEGIPIASLALEVDAVISIPKLKTHNLLPITGAIKNMFGVVPGLFKTKCHLLAPRPKEFAHLLVNIFSWVQPKLSIVDAVWAMEGEGPSAGNLRRLGLILASSDAVALDAVASYIVGLDPLDLLTTKEAHDRGIGQGELEAINVVGEDLEEVRFEDFQIPPVSIVSRLPGPVLRGAKRFVRHKPMVDKNKCRGCEVCVESCPVQAIRMDKTKPRFDYRKCILCLCCQEFCTQGAIYIEENILNKIGRLLLRY